ncbi:hypothetical protein [Planomonospora parontospora]|uniref:hypothetical protein n=1 Tax=Planomonospora parontospora TaxID=58119 RepID=UPI0016712D0F|nr:hypothetical protein [Planomonospora parontospora]GGL57754.1 hypothetical protein GCM10014719_68980 [Planomonospora parontospora subsp. antibiotica]GII19242.1 hypothetical protein Ppa05_59680 [Planomonospora parontospora subsp. antibiotica]
MDRHPPPEAGDDHAPMTSEERGAWLYAILVPVTSLAYFAAVVPRLFEQPAAEVSWAVPMLWAVGASFAGSVAGSIVLTVLARGAGAARDVRDREIERHGDRIAQAVTAFGAAAVLALAMLEADHFWIGNALFLIGAVGATWGAVARIRAYRGAFHG